MLGVLLNDPAAPPALVGLWMSLRSRLRRLLTGDVAYLRYQVLVRWRGIDFAGHAESAAPSGGPDLARVLRQLAIPAGATILDVGCGAGSACCTLAAYFDRVVGIELNTALVARARRNLQRWPGTHRVSILSGDALTLDLDPFTHLYLFNPFPPDVAARFFARVRESLQRTPRPLVVIYKCPGEPPLPRDLCPTRQVITNRHTHPIYVCRT